MPAFAQPFRRRRITETLLLNSRAATDAPHWWRCGWFWFGLAFLIAAFAWLEYTQPFYFSEDDCLVNEMPGILEGCRSLWHGCWPEYDPYRCMGGPLAPIGVFSLTYPPTYLSYAIARNLFQQEMLVMEVHAALHLLAGYFICWLLARRLGMRPMLAAYVTLAFELSGSVLIMGRSWHVFMPMVVWPPLLMLAIDDWWRRVVGWKWALGTGISSAMLFHVGFPQLWFYAALLGALSVFVLIVSGRVEWRRSWTLVSAGLISLGVMAPLLVPQVRAAAGLTRTSYGSGISWQWIGTLIPYPLMDIPHPMHWGSVNFESMGQFYYFGTLLAAVFFVGIVMWVCSGLRHAADNVWLICGLGAMVLAMGKWGGIYLIFAHLPLLRSVNNDPFRALPMFVLFAAISGGVIVERLMRHGPAAQRRMTFMIAIGFGLLAYHVSVARASFYTYNFSPMPKLPQAIGERIQNTTAGRTISWSPQRSISPGWPMSLPQNLPLAYDVVSFTGADPTIEYGVPYVHATDELARDPLATLRAYGVRWQLFSPLLQDPASSISPNPDSVLKGMEMTPKYPLTSGAVLQYLQPIAMTPDVQMFELPDAAPLAFTDFDPARPLPIRLSCSGIDVDVSALACDVTVNFLFNDRMHAVLDGKPVTLSADPLGRMVVPVRAGTSHLRVYYDADWLRSSALGAVLVIAGFVSLRFMPATASR